MRHLLLILIFPLFFLVSCIQDKKVEIDKYDIFTTAKKISKFYNISLDTSGSSENVTLRKFYDGAFEINYEYDLRESNVYNPLFYSIRIEYEPSVLQAMKNFQLTKRLLLTVNSATKRNVSEIDSLTLPGDQHFYAIRTSDNLPSGVFLVIRENKIVYSLTMSGLYSSDNSIITDLILPDIKNLSDFTLDK